VFGALLGRQCDVQLANRVADSVCALHASRQAETAEMGDPANPADPANVAEPSVSPEHREKAQSQTPESTSAQRPASVFQELWQNLFGVRS
jgi:hypothetical protein